MKVKVVTLRLDRNMSMLEVFDDTLEVDDNYVVDETEDGVDETRDDFSQDEGMDIPGEHLDEVNSVHGNRDGVVAVDGLQVESTMKKDDAADVGIQDEEQHRKSEADDQPNAFEQ